MSTALAPETTALTRWTSLHCFLHWRRHDVDDFLATTLRPLLDAARGDGLLGDWFFIRYWQGGPHLRLRALGVVDPDDLRARIAGAVAGADYPRVDLEPDTYLPGAHPPEGGRPAPWFPHGAVEEIAYEPETARYGGAAALTVAERVFCRSTEVALDVLTTVPPAARMRVAVGLVHATAVGLGLDDLAAARWLRGAAGAWRWVAELDMLPAATVLANTTKALTANADSLRERLTALRACLDTHPGVEAHWAREVASAHRELSGSDAPAEGRWLVVWASQAHMLCNRLGLQPDEERALYWLISGALLGHTAPAEFHADRAASADRVFLERSKFLPGLPEQRPVDAPKTASSHWTPRGPFVDLPEGEPPDMAISAAIDRRTSAREFVGPVTAAEIGTLLRIAYGTRESRTIELPGGARHTYTRRGYPSAGGRYPARLRLVVADVEGIRPGCYQVETSGARLLRVAALPDLGELVATSMWFSASAVGGGAIDISGVPAILALSVDLDAARTKYGTRALRFALLEAGHLAQNLTLVAAAQRLATNTLGGFYDDVVHELLGLDGVGESVQYLIPIGRASTP